MFNWLKRTLRSATINPVHPRDPTLAAYLAQLGATGSGVTVTPDTAMRLSAVFTAVRILSEFLAMTPVHLYRRLDEGKARAKGHRLATLFNRPNGFQTRFDWMYQAMAHANLWGSPYSRIIPHANGRIALLPLAPQRVRAKLLSDGRLGYAYLAPDGSSVTYMQDEILRVPFMTLDGVTPLSVISAQRESIGESIAAQDYGSRFWANDTPARTWIKFDGTFKTKEDADKFRESWQENQTGNNRYMTPVLPRGMELHALGVNLGDVQFLETRKFKRSEIFGMFRVPPHLGGDLERSTNNNIEQQSLEVIMYTMAPWYARFEQQLNATLLAEDEQEEFFFEFNVDGLLRGDSTAKSALYREAIYSGWMTRNEVRSMENRNPLPGLDEPLAPVNMTLAKKLGQQPAPVQQAPQQNQGGNENGN